MSSATFKILEDIAKDLSGDEITFPTFLDITFQVRTALKNPNLSVDEIKQHALSSGKANEHFLDFEI